jgi:ABC-type uncharacterized transport system permease subunit
VRTRTRAGWTGVALGLLAFFLAVPPAEIRTPAVPVALGVLAIAAGAFAVGGGLVRLGWGAIAAGVIGAAGGVAATKSGSGHLEEAVAWSALLAATLRYATPLLFAALGGLFSERSGVINIALEGMMLMGAFFAIWGSDLTNSWVGGLVVGMIAGGVLALIHAVFAISLRADQIVSGTALNFLAAGLTGYMFVDIYGNQGTPENLPAVPDVTLPGIKDIPFVGDVIGQLNLLVWLGLLTALLTWLVVFRTPAGLRLRSAGENPLAAETAGLSPVRIRYMAVVGSGMLAALGGAYLSIGFVHSFAPMMTAGRGFIALAVVIVGKWRPVAALAAALLFGFSQALAQRLPVFSESSATLLQALPYVVTLIAVAGLVGRSVPPAADGVPYAKE